MPYQVLSARIIKYLFDPCPFQNYCLFNERSSYANNYTREKTTWLYYALAGHWYANIVSVLPLLPCQLSTPH